MSRRLFVIALLVAISGFFVTPAAKADDNIVTNQWYTAQFVSNAPSSLFGAGSAEYTLGVDGPILPSGNNFANSVLAPTGTSWQITLTTSGTLTVTDLQATGDEFQMFDNGDPMAAAASPFVVAPQNPGWVSPGSGDTSASTVDGNYEAGDINASLGNADMSSATFALGSGVNVITGEWLAANNQGTGDMAFIAESSTPPVPEPSSIVLLCTGLLGVLFAFRKKLTA
jgi:hypothetical protein